MKWFNHDVDAQSNDKIFELIEAHGMMGYGIWWSILEELYKAEPLGFQISASEAWFKRMSKKLNLTDWRSLIRVLDTIAEQNLIDSQLWAEHVIYSPGIIGRADDYMKKKAQNAKRQADYREKNKAEKIEEKRVSNALLTVTNEESNDVTLSKTHSYSNSYSNSKAEEEINSKSVREDFPDFPDELVDPLVRETMPAKTARSPVPTEFSSMRFDEFWQFTVPREAKSDKGLAKQKFMLIEGVDYKTFREAYQKAVEAYLKKNPNEKPGEKFKYFKSLANWISAESWLDFVPEHMQGGSMNLELLVKALPRTFNRAAYVILPDGDWRVIVSRLSDAELAHFSRGSYSSDSYRKIHDINAFMTENPDAIRLEQRPDIMAIEVVKRTGAFA
jgi:hypothetical protein